MSEWERWGEREWEREKEKRERERKKREGERERAREKERREREIGWVYLYLQCLFGHSHRCQRYHRLKSSNSFSNEKSIQIRCELFWHDSKCPTSKQKINLQPPDFLQFPGNLFTFPNISLSFIFSLRLFGTSSLNNP